MYAGFQRATNGMQYNGPYFRVLLQLTRQGPHARCKTRRHAENRFTAEEQRPADSLRAEGDCCLSSQRFVSSFGIGLKSVTSVTVLAGASTSVSYTPTKKT